MKYIVRMKEVWIQDVEIEAKNKEEAVELVAEGQGDFVDAGPGTGKGGTLAGFEFSHTLDTDTWDVEEDE